MERAHAREVLWRKAYETARTAETACGCSSSGSSCGASSGSGRAPSWGSDGSGGSDDEADGLSSFAREVTESTHFKVAVMVIILLHVASIAMQVDFPGLTWRGVEVWPALNLTFLCFFTAELALRLAGHAGRGGWFFCAAGCEATSWNVFDFVVVFTGWLGYVAEHVLMLGEASWKFSVMIRIFRVLRVLRVLRLFKNCGKLRTIVRGLVESLAIVMWVALLLALVMLGGAYACTILIGRRAEEWGPVDEELVRRLFGSLGASMRTLFVFLTLDDWAANSRLVARHLPWAMPAFILYVVFAAFVVLSLLTAMITDHMDSVRQMELVEEKHRISALMNEVGTVLRSAFRKIDVHHHRTVGKEEFKRLLKDKHLVKELAAVDVHLDGIRSSDLFHYMDLDGGGWLTRQEFERGLMEFQQTTGELSAFQIMLLHGQISRLVREQVKQALCTRPPLPQPLPRGGGASPRRDPGSESLGPALHSAREGVRRAAEAALELEASLEEWAQRVGCEKEQGAAATLRAHDGFGMEAATALWF